MTTRISITCTACQKPLTDLETFGDMNAPMCRECHFSLMFDEGEPFDWLLNMRDIWSEE